ncbi:MAG: prephenate dehydratase [Bacteroidia bacterium]|nr:prephenate dehydratase [Bacteroidia bacterium]
MSQIISSKTKPRIAIQGIKGAFHEIAARKFFGQDIEIEECRSFPELFDSLDQKIAPIGVVAIENTLAGTILPNYALLRNSDFRIIGEIYLRIEHQLMAIENASLESLRKVYSHPMAIEQCREYFKPFPHISLVESEDTAASARFVQESNSVELAAIGSRLAAKHYGLETLRQNIETNPHNFTRFWVVVSKDQTAEFVQNPNKSSISFVHKHEVGSLAQILLLLSGHGMNLTKIQSLPVVGQAWKYFFHVDLEFDDYEQYQRAIAAINFQVDELMILGEYPRGQKEG